GACPHIRPDRTECNWDKAFRGIITARQKSDAPRERFDAGAIIPRPFAGGRLRLASTAVLLFLSSCTTAIIHALIPDHWLPFVLLSRVERWSERRGAAVPGRGGRLHPSGG